MKQLLLLLIVCLTFCCASTKNDSNGALSIDGMWIPIHQEIGGKKIPSVAFQAQTLLIAGNTYTLTAESEDKGDLKYNNGQMDIYSKEGVNAGKHFTAIYTLDHEQLTICYNLKGDVYPSNFETASAPTLFLSVFKKR